MLEGLLRKIAVERGLDARIESAGLHKSAKRNKRTSWRAQVCMRRRHLDIRNHRSRHVDVLDISTFDLIVVMEPMMQVEVEKCGYHNRLVVLNVRNPLRATLQAYESCAKQLEREAEKIADAL